MQKSVNSFSKGLNLSQDNINQPKDTYSYALNVVKEDPLNNPTILFNEKGFSNYLGLSIDYILVGYVYLGKEDYCFFTKNIPGGTPSNKIYYYTKSIDEYTLIYDSIDLNFNNLYPIKGTYRINYKGERIVYWVDGLNEDRTINVDSNIYTGIVDELSIDVRYSPAVLISKVINDNGGDLITGTYEFFGAYKTQDNAISPWFILSATPSYIIDDSTVVEAGLDNILIDGCDSKLPTNKSITLHIENLDSRFFNFRLGILKTFNGSQSAFYIDNIFYGTANKSYTYTGNSKEVIIPDITELLVDHVRYYGSNAISQVDNRLLRANTESENIDIEYQTFANNIVVDYYIEEELCGTQQDTSDRSIRDTWWQSANTTYSETKSLMRDEVYSLGIAFGLKKENTESQVYHIPGRALNSIPSGFVYKNQYNDSPVLPYLTNWDSISITENGDTSPRWKVYNTAALSDDDITVHKPAYWESDEFYPNGLDLPIIGSSNTGVSNTNIRHHKMPSSGLEPIFKTVVSGDTLLFYKRNLGLKFSNIVVPDALKDNISYIRIYITPRDTDQNKSIIAKGIFTNCSLTKINIGDFDVVSTNNYIHPCAPYNDLNEITNGGCYRTGQDDGWDTYSNHYHSFYSPDTTLKSPTINTNRVTIENEVIGEVHYYTTLATSINAGPYLAGSDGHKNSADDGGYVRDLFYDDSNHGRTLPTGQTSSHAVYNITGGNFRTTYKSICILNTINQITTDKSRRKLKQAVYVPFNANLSSDQIGGMDNPYISEYGSSNVLLELSPIYDNLGVTETLDNSVQFIDNNPAQNYTDPSQGSDVFGTFHFHPVDDATAVYRYGSIKRDNSTQYGTIDNIVYNPTDIVIVNPTFDDSNLVLDTSQGLIGDCWIDMFSVKRTRFSQKEHYTFGGKPEFSVGESTFFTESNINHRLRYAEGIDYRNYYPKQVISTSIKQYLDAGFNFPIITNDNYYKENPDFDKSTTKENIGLSLLDVQLFGITKYITRILYSEKLLNEDIVDSYRVFLANNYIDLPKNTGFITHIFKRNQELYVVTRDALWKVYASNETIKSDVGSISIGNGEFFSLEPTEVLSIEGGHGGSSSKSSLVETPYGYFFVDKNKGKFILFKDRQGYYDNNQQTDISLQGVYNFTKDNFKLPYFESFDTPLANSGYTIGYDPNFKRILITKLDYKLNSTQFISYKGPFNPSGSYTAGDIYLKEDGFYYTYVGTSSEYTTFAESSDLSDFTSTQVDAVTSTHTTPSNGVIDIPFAEFLRYTPNTDFTGDDIFNISMNCATEVVTVTVIPIPPEHFTVYGQYGMTLTGVFNSSTTGIPSSFNTLSLSAGATFSDAYTTITAGTLQVSLTGTPISPFIRVFLEINGVPIDSKPVPGPGSYTLTIPLTNSPANILIGLES